VFHGSDDSQVAVDESHRIVGALREANDDIKYIEYEGADHWIWVRIYSNSDAIDWLFDQSK